MKHVTAPRVVLGVGWMLFLLYAYPGYMSADSVDQLQQARGLIPITDWHPPVMQILWRYLDKLVAGPLLMLVLQSVLFHAGMFAILRRVLSPLTAAITASVILVSPPVVTQMAVIWKDMQMAGFLLAGTACILAEHRAWKVTGCGLFVLATAMRYNAPAATLLLVGGLLVWTTHRWRRYGFALATWFGITLIAMLANRACTEVTTHPWHNSLAIYDIVGTVRFAPELDDAEILEAMRGMPVVVHTDLRRKFAKAYLPNLWWQIAHDERRVVDPPSTPEHLEATSRAWRDLVLGHPKAYLKHRLRVYRELLGTRPHGALSPIWDMFVPSAWQASVIDHHPSHTFIQRGWLAAMRWLEFSWVFRPWLYAVLSIVLLAMSRRDRLAATLLTSGLAYELGLFLAAPSSDFRYSHWMITTTLIGLALVFTRRYRAPR